MVQNYRHEVGLFPSAIRENGSYLLMNDGHCPVFIGIDTEIHGPRQGMTLEPGQVVRICHLEFTSIVAYGSTSVLINPLPSREQKLEWVK